MKLGSFERHTFRLFPTPRGTGLLFAPFSHMFCIIYHAFVASSCRCGFLPLAFACVNSRAYRSLFRVSPYQQLLSKQQEMTAQLQRALAAKSEFQALISHELRTPLFGVLVSTAKTRAPGEVEARQVRRGEQREEERAREGRREKRERGEKFR